ncbi:MAG: response regulator [Eubacterium sp.]|nr:response regulator [Eubacterium sp.]
MPNIFRRSKLAYTVQGFCILFSAWSLFAYLNFDWLQSTDGVIASLFLAFGYTFPLIFIDGLYGVRSAILSYTLILIPTIFISPGEAFLLTFHLILIFVVEFWISRGFLKTLPKTIVSGVISGVSLNIVFFIVNHLVAEGQFTAEFSEIDFTGMADIGLQVVVGFLVLHIGFRFLPAGYTKIFPVGRFKKHVKNEEFEKYNRVKPKKALGKKIIQILVFEALVLGFFAALVANALIPDLGDVIEVRSGAVSGGAAMYRPSRKPDMESTTTTTNTETKEGFSTEQTSGETNAAQSTTENPSPQQSYKPDHTPKPGEEPELSEEEKEKRRRHIEERTEWYLSRTRLAAFGSDDDESTIFVLNGEGLAFDLKLILFLFDIVMPIVILFHYLLERRTVRPIAGMALAMNEFATESLEDRQAAAEKINNYKVKTKDEVEQLHESLSATVNEVVDYIIRLQEEQKLKEDLRVAQRASEAKSTFLSNISHEIRTPINSVLGMDEMILRESTDPRIRKYATDIKNSGRTLVSLINDLLDFSRIEAGKLDILPVEYEMSSTLNDLVNMISVKADEKELEFAVDVDETIPHLLIGDEIRVKQCVINILNNAVKYTEKGSVKLTVSYEKEDDTHILVRFDVADTGIGMKQEDLNRLFTPFERIEENRNRNIEGAGLGMSIVKNLLDMMDSELEVKSEYGKGSEFGFVLRQEVISWEPMGDFAKMYQKSIESAKEYSSYFEAPDAHILVVDDTKMNLTVIKGLLEPTKVNVTTATSGIQAMEKVKQEQFDLIFLDQRMPGLDGIETLQEMKKTMPERIENTPIIALTANAISGARERFIKAGFDDYLTKPIDSMKLERTIAAFLPEEKVVRKEADDLGNGGGSVVNETLKSYAEFEEVNFSAAMENCMRENILLEALNDFSVATKTGPEEIEDFLNNNDIKNYTIKVHALKSSSRLIGALDISKQAAYLESCGDDENVDEINKLTPKLLQDYRAFSAKLETLLAGPDEEADDRPEIDESALNEAYAGIREYVDAFDFDSADSIMEMLAGYRVPDAQKERYEKIKDMVTKLDHDGLMEELV